MVCVFERERDRDRERERGQSHETASPYALRFLHLDSPEMVSTASGFRSHLDL